MAGISRHWPLALALLPTTTSAVAAELDTGRLQSLLRHDCGSCHGLTLHGGLGPPLTAAALDGKPPSLLVDTILDGRPGTPMPGWRGILTVEEARWLAGYLRQGQNAGK